MKNTASEKTQHNFLLALLFGAIALSFFVFAPFLTALILAAMFAVVLHPLFARITGWFKGYRPLASILTILLACIIVIAPLSFLGSQIFKQSRDLYIETTTTGGGAYLENLDMAVERIVGRVVPDFSFEIEQYVGALSEFVTSNLTAIFSGTVQTVFFFFITIFALFFFLKDGEEFSRAIVALSPLPDQNDREIILRLKRAVNSVIKGFLLVGLIQGTVAGIGFWIFGVPHPALWGGITVIAALIPGVGTALVVAPAIIYLFATGAIGGAIGLCVWGALAVGLIDNLVGPTLIGQGVKIHPLFILFSVLGGIAFFGPAGFLLGPLVLSLLYVLLDTYKRGLVKEEDAASAA